MKKFIVLGVMALTAALQANAVPLVLDNFSTGAQVVTDNSVGAGGCAAGAVSGTGCFDTALGTMIGGERDMSIDLVSSLFGNGATAAVNIPPDAYSFNAGSGSSAIGVLQYDGIDGSMGFNTAGLGVLDFSTYTNLVFDVLRADAGFGFDVTFCSDAGATCQTNSFVAAGTLVPAQRVEALAQWNLVNFASISAMEFVIDPFGSSLDVDLTLDAASVVPEPSAIGLLGLGLLMLGVRKRQQSNLF